MTRASWQAARKPQQAPCAYLDGVGEGQTDGSSTQDVPHDDSEDAHSQHQDGTIQVAVEGKPQVQRLSVEQGAMVLVDLVGSSGDEELVLVEGSHNWQALQGLSNQANQVTCREGSVASRAAGLVGEQRHAVAAVPYHASSVCVPDKL
jgi:hypothetical protein